MRRVLALLAGLTMVAGVAFAADSTTRPAFVPKTTDGAIIPARPELPKTTDGAIRPEKPELPKTTDGAIRPEKPELPKTTDGAIRPERPQDGNTTDGAIKPEKPELPKTTDGAIKPGKPDGKGNAFGQQREKNPVAEMNINKVKPAELTDEQKAALKAKFEEIKAAKEKEEGNTEKKGKFGKGKKQ